VGVERDDAAVLVFVERHVVDQQANAHPAIGCPQHGVEEQAADQVVVPQVVLGIDTAFSAMGQQHARGEGIEPLPQQLETRVPGIFGKVVLKGFAQGSVGGIGYGERGFLVDILRQAGAAMEQRDQ